MVLAKSAYIIFTVFSSYIIYDRLLFAVTDKQENSLSDEFRWKSRTTCYVESIVKIF